MNKGKYFSIWIMMYLMSLILGAGILSLPYAALRVGFIPFLIITIGVAFLFWWVYKYTVNSVKSHISKEINDYLLVGENVYRKEYHNAITEKWKKSARRAILEWRIANSKNGIYADLLGEYSTHKQLSVKIYLIFMILTCGGFIIAFVNIGHITIASLSSYLATIGGSDSTMTGIILLVIGISMVVTIVIILLLIEAREKIGPGRMVIIGILLMFGFWMAGIGTMIILGTSGALALGVFVTTGIVGKLFATAITPSARKRKEFELDPNHRKSALMTFVELIVLFISVAVAIVVLAVHPEWLLTLNINFTDIFSLVANISVVCGSLFFAFAGPLYMIVMYDEIYAEDEEKPGKHSKYLRTISLTPFVVMIVYVLFTLSIMVTVPHDILAAGDAAGEQVIIPLSALITTSTAKFVVVATGYFYALVAITNVFIGYLDVMADTLQTSVSSKYPFFKGKIGQLTLWLIMLVISLMAFTFAEIFNVLPSLSTIIGFIGSLGAGVYILAVPFLLPQKSDGKGKTKVALALAIISGILAIMAIL